MMVATFTLARASLSEMDVFLGTLVGALAVAGIIMGHFTSHQVCGLGFRFLYEDLLSKIRHFAVK